MKVSLLFLSMGVLLITSCQHHDKAKIKQEIYQTEKAFERMTAEKGIAEAFYFFAADSAVIKRESDTLIVGNNNIKLYYEKKNFDENVTVNWTPDYINVSESGDLAYTYGNYSWKFKQPDGTNEEYKGVFHTVWKRQADGNWKYVWD